MKTWACLCRNWFKFITMFRVRARVPGRKFKTISNWFDHISNISQLTIHLQIANRSRANMMLNRAAQRATQPSNRQGRDERWTWETFLNRNELDVKTCNYYVVLLSASVLSPGASDQEGEVLITIPTSAHINVRNGLRLIGLSSLNKVIWKLYTSLEGRVDWSGQSL